MKHILFLLNVLNSPFKPFKIKWYFGKVALGTPYFYPRKWIKFTEEDCIKEATKSINNKSLVKKTFSEWMDYYKNHTKAIPRLVGFDFVQLGWKTKYDSYRYEWSPMWSFVFFGYQIAITFVVPHPDQYWESYLYYSRDTDKSLSKIDRIITTMHKYPQVWTRYKDNNKTTTNYYKKILRPQYLKYISNCKNCYKQLEDCKCNVDTDDI